MSQIKISDLKKSNQPEILDLKKNPIQKKPENQPEKKNAGLSPESISDKAVFWWSIEEKKQEKTLGWYFLAGTFVALMIIFALIQRNWLFILIVFLAWLAYWAISRNQISENFFRISSHGLEVNSKLYRFSEMSGFGLVDRQEPSDTLVFQTKSMGQKFIIVPIKKDQEKIRAFLKKWVPEKKYEETILDALEEFLNF